MHIPDGIIKSKRWTSKNEPKPVKTKQQAADIVEFTLPNGGLDGTASVDPIPLSC